MLFGDPMRREGGFKTQSCFRCFSGPNFQGDDLSPCADTRLDFEGFPPGPCLGGIRSNIHFPTCWDGKSLDSPNHREHVAYPVVGPSSFAAGGLGACPESHPVKIPQLMLEVRNFSLPATRSCLIAPFCVALRIGCPPSTRMSLADSSPGRLSGTQRASTTRGSGPWTARSRLC